MYTYCLYVGEGRYRPAPAQSCVEDDGLLLHAGPAVADSAVAEHRAVQALPVHTLHLPILTFLGLLQLY